MTHISWHNLLVIPFKTFKPTKGLDLLNVIVSFTSSSWNVVSQFQQLLVGNIQINQFVTFHMLRMQLQNRLVTVTIEHSFVRTFRCSLFSWLLDSTDRTSNIQERTFQSDYYLLWLTNYDYRLSRKWNALLKWDYNACIFFLSGFINSVCSIRKQYTLW